MTEKYTETKTFDSDKPMTVLGVPGRLTHRTICSKTQVGCWEHQRWISERRTRTIDGEVVLMRAEIRFDDNCHNGKNSFAITGHGWYDHYKSRDWDFGGACHDMIVKVFPELEPLIKWHLMDAEGPMHYVSNVTYFAGDRDHNGRLKGEPSAWDTAIKFGEFPITYKLNPSFAKWLAHHLAIDEPLTIVEIPYSGNDTYKFAPKYSFNDFCGKWHECPFDTRQEAEQFKEALAWGWSFLQIPTQFSEGKERELDKARRAAVWPEATDEQLMLPKEELTKLLETRLEGLVAEFREQVEACGLLWSPEDFR